MPRFIACLLALLLAAAPGQAAPLSATEILTQFNAVVAGTFTSHHDVEGRLVAGTIHGGGSTLYIKPNAASGASPFAAVNVVNITGSGRINVNNGGNVNFAGGLPADAGSRFNLNGGHFVSQSPGFTISDFTAPLDALQAQLSGMTATSAITGTDPNLMKLTVVPGSDGIAVFTIAATDLARLNNISFVGETAADTIIINVTGGSYTQPGGQNFNGSEWLNRHVIWNFADATSLSLKFWHGAILAGKAAVTNSSPLEGFLYANSFSGGGELHDFPFAGTLVSAPPPGAVPEPGSALILALGLMGLAATLRRRARQPAAALA
ncbi:choice-of-anchor A family protein [Siccirubricoccus phaeus]|uniref:choice-of-anchor A family protein n=1 Tax=Siccirubricoccus phaeus TaxID=2595053 RepID=UPI0011F27169|nr:choice-of-anchor A family protein [Siccirubricoccus phaeus]